mmetsp:Transcript_24446/g.32752  ORF Transcript_24446/g.32752 Transcript_24446/m.32752 type:complete len:101 (+) Transcript_24446:46-348(+)
MNDHEKRVTRGLDELLVKDPKGAKKLQVSAVLPMPEVMNAFKSPTREQLQDYAIKESVNKPPSTQYRPKFGQVLKREAAFAVPLSNLQENKGTQLKQDLF